MLPSLISLTTRPIFLPPSRYFSVLRRQPPFPARSFSFKRHSAASGGNDGPSSIEEGVKHYLDKKYQRTADIDVGLPWPTDRPLDQSTEPVTVLQPRWAGLERRLAGRKPRRDGPSGRINVRRSEEDYWLESGAYEGLEPTNGLSAVLPGSPRQRSSFELTAELKARSDLLPSAGYFSRHATVTVDAVDAESVVAEYNASVYPVLREFPGFKRVLLIYDEASGTLHSLSMWEDEELFLAASASTAYSACMSTIAKFFTKGLPEVKNLKVMADFSK